MRCHLLGIFPSDGWLVGFEDPERGLDLGSPCYLPEHCVYGFTPDPGSAHQFAPGSIRLADNIWENVHNWIARVLKERRRAEAAEARAAQKAAEKNPRSARINEDRMLRSRNAKKRAAPSDERQTDMFLKLD